MEIDPRELKRINTAGGCLALAYVFPKDPKALSAMLVRKFEDAPEYRDDTIKNQIQ